MAIKLYYYYLRWDTTRRWSLPSGAYARQSNKSNEQICHRIYVELSLRCHPLSCQCQNSQPNGCGYLVKEEGEMLRAA